VRTPLLLLTVLTVAALSGCGTAGTAESGPSFVAQPSASAPAVSSPGPEPAISTEPEVSAEPVVSTEPEVDIPAAVKPTRKPESTTVPKQRGSGPAGSLMRTGQPGVALTFDDGPDPVNTPRLLDLLKRTHVKATFCLVGQNVAAHPDLVRRIADEGHTLCNHSWRHSLTLGRQKPSVIRADLRRTNDAIRAAVPGAEIKYMRAPGGNFTPAFVRQAALLGMTSIYWQVDPRDWEHPAGETAAAHRAKVIGTVRHEVGKGAIVLSHDYRQPGTITAYETLIPWLKRHYRLIALPVTPRR
jgi:peptidoglycan/xylan/chitin deacetylase (PgdA/CDA1 family)